MLFRFFKEHKLNKIFKQLANANTPEQLEHHENIMFVAILSPIMFISGFFCIAIGLYWHLKILIIAIQSLSLIFASEGIVAIIYSKLTEHKKRHLINLTIATALMISYFLYYEKMIFLFWIIFIIILLPTVLNTSKLTYFYFIGIVIFVIINRLSKIAQLHGNYDLAFSATFFLMLIFIFFEIYMLNLIYHFVIEHKSTQVENLINKKEEITGLYEEILASEEELREKNEQLNRYNLIIQKNHEELNYLVHYDVLTKQPNRIMIQKQIHKMVHPSNDKPKDFALVYIDIDNFKKINDSLGHSIGDQLLVAVSDRLMEKAHPKDTVGRLGGDEFAILVCHDFTEDNLLNYLREIATYLTTQFVIGNYEMSVTASFGVALWPTDAANAEELLRAADTAMNKAKELGRNTIHFYHEKMKAHILDRIQMENHLAKALDLKELYLEYQPLISTEDEKTYGFEALLRWQSVEYGRVSPMTFIPLMEDLGIIHAVGNWVIEQACQKVNQINKEYKRSIVISVNVSALQMKKRTFINDVKKILLDANVDPSQIKFELTESVFIENIEEMKRIICELKELGILIAIDDFGTGYSSLSYILDLPLDSLKIDKSFTEQINRSNKKKNIVASIIALAHNLNMNVIAEGVENEIELNYLIEKKCDLIQGYYYSKPLPEDEMNKFL